MECEILSYQTSLVLLLVTAALQESSSCEATPLSDSRPYLMGDSEQLLMVALLFGSHLAETSRQCVPPPILTFESRLKAAAGLSPLGEVVKGLPSVQMIFKVGKYS